MENVLTLMILGIIFGLGIAIGMYITSQIGDWINRNIKKKR